MNNRSCRLIFAALVAGLVSTLTGADDATQEIKGGELAFKVPAAWKKERPKSSMRLAQLKVDPAAGDTEPAELLVFAFPNGAGTVDANIARWESQFVGPDGKTPKAQVDNKKGKNVDVTRVEVAGRYVAAVSPGAEAKNNKPDARLLGAIVQTPRVGYFFKMVGPEKTMLSARAGFDAMIASMTKTEE